MALSPLQVAQHAYNAGWRTPGDLAIATAIAGAESNYNPRAHNPTPPDNSYGLWQINMLGAMGPARRRQFGITSNEQLFDPAINAKAAFMVFKQQGWRAWSVYKNGMYRKYLPAATEAANRVVLSGGNIGGELVATNVSFASGGIAALSALGDLVRLLTNPKTWLRVGAFGVGALLLLYGLSELTGAANRVQQVGKTAVNAVVGSKTGGLVQA